VIVGLVAIGVTRVARMWWSFAPSAQRIGVHGATLLEEVSAGAGHGDAEFSFEKEELGLRRRGVKARAAGCPTKERQTWSGAKSIAERS
jgi:hypothetical protein